MTAVAAGRVTSAAHARAVATRLAREFAEGAAARDRDRALPYAEIDRLASSGLLAVTVPAEYGGAQLPPSVVADVVRILAAADPNIAQIPHSHFVYLNLLRLAGSPQQRSRYFGAVLDGARIANAQSERTGSTVADISTTVRPEGSGFRIDGTKFYCTGSLFADILAVLTRLDDPENRTGLPPGEYVAFLPADTDGVRIIDDWQGIGQRTTGSGTVEFDAALVSGDQLVARAAAVGAPSGYGAFAQLLHAAIDTGIARGGGSGGGRSTAGPAFRGTRRHRANSGGHAGGRRCCRRLRYHSGCARHRTVRINRDRHNVGWCGVAGPGSARPGTARGRGLTRRRHRQDCRRPRRQRGGVGAVRGFRNPQRRK